MTSKANGIVNDGFENSNGIPMKNGSAYDNKGFDSFETKVKVDEEHEFEEEDDPWKVTHVDVDEVPWRELKAAGLCLRILKYLFGVILILGFLYMFICSLDFLSSAFKLLGGKAAGRVFQNNEIFTNPVAGLMMGVLVTVLVQSSSTSTSIIISMVGADILTIPIAIPIVMGANIGTSVTNTIVALGQITNRKDFRRAFAGATVHDMFNWLTVIVLLPIEVITGYLARLSKAIVDSFPELQPDKSAKRDLLKVITSPFTKLIIEVDKNIISKIATNDHQGDGTLLKTCSDKVKPEACCEDELEGFSGYGQTNFTDRAGLCSTLSHCVKKPSCVDDLWSGNTFDCDKYAANTTCCASMTTTLSAVFVDKNNVTGAEKSTFCSSLINACQDTKLLATSCLTAPWEDVNNTFSCSKWTEAEKSCLKPKTHLFMGLVGKLDDHAIGAILLVVSLAILCICLVCIVKLLNALLKGQIALIIKKFINADFPGKCSYFTGYLAIILGAGLTFLVQSSSIFTSTLTPLVGIGVIELDRMYPLTLGANIGTTTTGILSALAQDGSKIRDSLQVALCHLFFNISGIILFYPLPFFRPAIPMAKFLGNTTAKYRWFALLYLAFMFFLFPAAVFGLSVPGWYVLAAVLIPIAVIIILVLLVKLIQHKRPSCLPPKFRNWKWLPEPLRSLRPYDYVMQRVCCPCLLKGKGGDEKKTEEPKAQEKGHVNSSYSGYDTRL